MVLEFRNVFLAPLTDFSAGAPNGCVIGVIGEKGCGVTALLQLAAGLQSPTAGEVVAAGSRRYLGITDSLNLAPVNLLLIEHAFAQADALVRARAMAGIDRLRAAGATILLASHEPALLRSICDEIWWLENGRLVERGDPTEVLASYNRRITEKFRDWGETLSLPVSPTLRRGDGRAEIVTLQTVGASGKASAVLRSGENAMVLVVVQFRDAVENPVVGMMIRTRIGLEVYGTNTELEKVKIGSCAAGDIVRVEFHFRCALCPKQYTLTAASHDPDGTAHDWLEDAISFQVSDARDTAGVANISARVSISKTRTSEI